MGFPVGDTGAPDISQNQRAQQLDCYTDLSAISWAMVTIRAHLVSTEKDTPTLAGSTHKVKGYTYPQPLPTLADIPVFPVHITPRGPHNRTVTPQRGNDLLSPPFCKGYISISIQENPFLPRLSPGTLPVCAEVPPGTLGLHRWIQHNRSPSTRCVGGSHPHHRHYLHI